MTFVLMKSVIQLSCYSVIILFVVACTNNSAVIQGSLPNDNYRDEWVYWAPMEGASSKTVDSVRINHDSFRLVLSAQNHNKLGIVRVRPVLRLALQEVVVFTEPGIIEVKLDSVSSASGTPLNEALQIWKNRKHQFDRETSILRKKLRTAETSEADVIRTEIEKVAADYYHDIFQMVLKNQNNEIGRFLLLRYKTFFTAEQISTIESLIK